MNKRNNGIFDVNELDLPDFSQGAQKSKEETKIKVIKSELERLNAVIAKQKKEILDLNEKVEKTKEEAFQQGFDEGYEKSKEDLTTNFEVDYNAKIEEFAQTVSATIDSLANAKSSVILDSEDSILRLIFKLVSKIIHKEISVDKSIIVEVIKNALPTIDMATKIEIIAHPDDVKTLKEFENVWMALTMKRDSVSYIEKDSITQGGLVIVSNLGTVDVQLETALANLQNALFTHKTTVKATDVEQEEVR